MVVHAVTLGPEGIARVRELRPEQMDAAMMRAAEDALARLRAGIERVVSPLPDEPDLIVGLGLPMDVQTEEALRRHWLNTHPAADPSAMPTLSDAAASARRHTEFYLARAASVAHYHLVPADLREEDAFLFGMACGALDNAHLARGARWVQEQLDGVRAKARQVVRDIVAQRPAFATANGAAGQAGMLADHFAVAMLASDS